jgi:hypothetical protein
MPDRDPLSWDERWRRPEYRRQPSQEVVELIADLWPDDSFSDVFQVKAGYLLVARAEDGFPSPSGQEDPLVAELTEMVCDELRRAGLPER